MSFAVMNLALMVHDEPVIGFRPTEDIPIIEDVLGWLAETGITSDPSVSEMRRMIEATRPTRSHLK